MQRDLNRYLCQVCQIESATVETGRGNIQALTCDDCDQMGLYLKPGAVKPLKEIPNRGRRKVTTNLAAKQQEKKESFITLNRECWIFCDDKTDPVILFEDPANIRIYKDHMFGWYKPGQKIPSNLWNTQWIHGVHRMRDESAPSSLPKNFK